MTATSYKTIKSTTQAPKQPEATAHKELTSALGAVFDFLRRILLFVFFGPGVLGAAWLVSKVFKKR